MSEPTDANSAEDSMIKYFREKIIGRPNDLSSSHETLASTKKKSSSQVSLDDLGSVSVSSNEMTITDRTISQVDKLTIASTGIPTGRRAMSPSSPIIIPKKPPRSNASSYSSSSYTSVVDQMSSSGEMPMHLRRESDDALLPVLPATGLQLKHSAARDRISVKNKRRQPTREKLSTLRETEDNETNLFATAREGEPFTSEKEQRIASPTRVDVSVLAFPQAKAQSQPLIDLSDLNTARARLRVSVRARDRSADNILLAISTTTDTSSIPASSAFKLNTTLQRSLSFKQPQDIASIVSPALHTRLQSTGRDSTAVDPANLTDQTNVTDAVSTHSMSRSSSQEHIYDNLDVFKRSKSNLQLVSQDDDPPSPLVKTRDNPTPANRLRPVTMHLGSQHDRDSTNEFENIFNQFKTRGSLRRGRFTNDKAVDPQPIITRPMTPTSKPTDTSPTPNRRKTLAGVHLSTSNKVVASDDVKPSPSWIDIAKQKQNKFQSISNDTTHHDDSDVPTPMVMSRKASSSVDNRSNRKSMFESTTPANAPVLERDSIRALKVGNPNRINNLIQFFDK